MDEQHVVKRGLKHVVWNAFVEYLAVLAYFAPLFSVFAWHRRLILAQQGVPVSDYWVPLVEAAVLAKVVIVVDMLRLAHRLESKPLIFPTLYKTFVFSVAILGFGVLEHLVRGLLHHEGIRGDLDDLTSGGTYELLARCMVKLVALVPFFAFREVARIMGRGKLAAAFLRHSPSAALGA